MASELPQRLRDAAACLPHMDRPSEAARHVMRLAADELESFEAAERERLEHEAASPDLGDLPLIPMPPLRQSFDPCAYAEARERYRDAMVAWVRAVTTTERSHDA